MTSITIETKYGHCEVAMQDDDLTIDEMIELFEQALSGIGYHWTGNIELISEYDIKISPSTQN
jgi:hypothetical protein